ncbi:serine hydrolase domain-containing protein [Actinorugispora endophytica]|uniref:CubicO group peptidase (Beta-lactamase class C family) n=1 Tax=Actinorugispora endophytica TaxID=1605990 RepID=A0A4R6V2Z5_9ACTN|nr:serine hydrolase domain-containing protein [Actinorugispora endophytica]TDQ53023.1 CubicO group peptidase (beta-lactamase class C family) [Actinorugispora endophytica]
MTVETGTPPARRTGRASRAGAVLLTAAAVLAAGAPPGAAADGTAALTPAAVDAFVTGYLDANGVPGAVVAVTEGERVVRVAGYGHDSTGAPMTADSPVPVASMSKSFTAMSVMRLVEEGSVALDAPVVEYLPEFRVADSRGDEITVRQLLDHTSGLSDTTFPEKSGPLPATLEERVAQLGEVEPAAAPGTRYSYHNPNYAVAARLVEVVGGEPFADRLESDVFAPLGMDDSTTVGDLRDAPEVPRGHVLMYGGAVAADEPSWFLDGSSGVVTTADDLAEWLVLHATGHPRSGTGPVSPDTLAAMRAPGEGAAGEADAGLGWNLEGAGAGHGGWLFTYTSQQIVLPESGHGIAVVLNGGLNTGGVEARVVAEGLAELAEGGAPEVGPPVLAIVDGVMALLTLAAAALGAAAVLRAPRWAAARARGPVRRLVLASAPHLLPLALLAGLHPIAEFVFNGRDASWWQLLHVTPTVVVWLVTGSLAGLAAVGARARHAARVRRSR